MLLSSCRKRVDIRFLGLHISSNLTCSLNTSHLVRKDQQTFLPKEAEMGRTLLSAAYNLLQSRDREHPLAQCICVVRSCTKQDKKDLAQMVKAAQWIVGCTPFPDFDSLARPVTENTNMNSTSNLCLISYFTVTQLAANLSSLVNSENQLVYRSAHVKV